MPMLKFVMKYKNPCKNCLVLPACSLEECDNLSTYRRMLRKKLLRTSIVWYVILQAAFVIVLLTRPESDWLEVLFWSVLSNSGIIGALLNKEISYKIALRYRKRHGGS